MSTIENKQPQPTDTEPSVADDLFTVIDVEDQESRISEARQEAVRRFRAGQLTRNEYNALVQTGATFGESIEQILEDKKQAALERINSGQSRRFGHRVVNLLRRK